MDSPTRLYLIRHGEVEARYQRVFGGRIDMELSPLGKEQARALALYLQAVPFDSIFVSPMKRVQQTVEKLVEHQTKAPVVLSELREVDFGCWTGLAWDEIQARFGISAYDWLTQLEQGLINEAEPFPQFRARIDRAVQQILGAGAGRTFAVVCHGGVIRMILAVLLDLPLSKMAGFDFEYASLTIVDWLPRKVEVQLLNYTPWRDSR
ncbi:MAG: histidine phosphatase family protein [Verrucomicrobiota bacterium]